MKIFLELMWFFKQERKSYIKGVLALAVVAFLQLIPPWIIGWIVDEMTYGTLTYTRLFAWVGFLMFAGLSMYFLRYIWRKAIFGSSVLLSKQMRSRLFEHFTRMPTSFYQKKRTGNLMAHATNDVEALQSTAGFGVLSLFDSFSQGLLTIVAMLWINWQLTLLTLLPMPIIAIATKIYGKYLFQRFHLLQEAFSNMNERTQESINGVQVTKSFGQEQEEIAAFVAQSEDVLVKNYRVAKIDGLFDPTIGLVASLCYMLALGFGGYFVMQDTLSIGQLIAFSTYLGLLIWPMLAFGFLFNIVERGRASYYRMMSLLDEKIEIKDHLNAIDEMPTGQIRYNIKRFSYPNETKPVLENIEFTIHPGDTLGIVGKTGSGKTTLLRLLIREFDLRDGKILFGHHDVSHYKINQLRKAVGFVPQENFLFSTTIRENIAFADVECPLAEVEAAAELANIHRDILTLPEGYETVVGERGVSLSGGQKQRVSIARALLMNSEVLVLDDALSAVDAKTEEKILRNLKEERKGKTTLIAAHRLSAIQHAQLILVLEEGRIVQSGTHEALLAENGWYQEMYKHQQLEVSVERGA